MPAAIPLAPPTTTKLPRDCISLMPFSKSRRSSNWSNTSLQKSCYRGTARSTFPGEKAKDTNTYCYRAEEFVAMEELCRAIPDLNWFGDVALTTTGMRTSERQVADGKAVTSRPM